MEAQALMTSPVITIRPEATVGEAGQVMLGRHVSCLPVVDDEGELVGIITHPDFSMQMRYHPLAQEQYTFLDATTTPVHIEGVSRQVRTKLVAEVMHPVVTAELAATLLEVLNVMLGQQVHRIPVVQDSTLVGIITRHDFLKLIVREESAP